MQMCVFAYLASQGVDAIILLKVFRGFLLVFLELFDDIRANVTVILLDGLSNTEGILRWDVGFATLTKQILNKRSDIATCNRHTLD